MSSIDGKLKTMASNNDEEQPHENPSFNFGVDLMTRCVQHLEFLKSLHEGGVTTQVSFESLRRYLLWLKMIAKINKKGLSTDLLVPPKDVAWLWYCHRLSPSNYQRFVASVYCDPYCSTKKKTAGWKDPTGDFYTVESNDFSQQTWCEYYPNESFDIDPIAHEQSVAKKGFQSVTKKGFQSPLLSGFDLLFAAKKLTAFYKQIQVSFGDTSQSPRDFITSNRNYHQFMHLFRKHPNLPFKLVPTDDIRFMWYTHMTEGSNGKYMSDCESFCGKFIDHHILSVDEGVEVIFMDSLESTADLWRSAYNDDFPHCYANLDGARSQLLVDSFAVGFVDNRIFLTQPIQSTAENFLVEQLQRCGQWCPPTSSFVYAGMLLLPMIPMKSNRHLCFGYYMGIMTANLFALLHPINSTLRRWIFGDLNIDLSFEEKLHYEAQANEDASQNVGTHLEKRCSQHLQFLKALHDSGVTHHISSKSFQRYFFWLKMLAKMNRDGLSTDQLVPPKDVAWLWYCHRLSPSQYQKFVRRVCFVSFSLDNHMPHISDPTGNPYVVESNDTSRQTWYEHYPNESFELEPIAEDESTVKLSFGNSNPARYDLLCAAKKLSEFTRQLLVDQSPRDFATAVQDYQRFIRLFRVHRNLSFKLVPTDEIRFIWYTHMTEGSVEMYESDCSILCGKLIDHDILCDDAMNDVVVQELVERTVELWHSTNEDDRVLHPYGNVRSLPIMDSIPVAFVDNPIDAMDQEQHPMGSSVNDIIWERPDPVRHVRHENSELAATLIGITSLLWTAVATIPEWKESCIAFCLGFVFLVLCTRWQNQQVLVRRL